MQLVHYRYNKSKYAHLLENYRKRMDGWKSKTLSLAGRIMLANSIITSLLIFQMQTHSSVTKEMNKMVRKCIWDYNEDQRRIHVGQEDVGRTGVHRAKKMNTVLLGSLGWRLPNVKVVLWSHTLMSKYGRGREGLNIFAAKLRSSHV